MAWIDTVSWADSEGPLRDAYDWQAAALGEPAEFTMLGSLYPAIVEERLRLYRTVEHCPSQLSAVERQSAALVTSRLNGTDHCASGLRLKLESLGLAAAVLDAIDADPANVDSGDGRFDVICAYAAKLTRSPDMVVQRDVDRLRDHGPERPRHPRSQQHGRLLRLHQPGG